MTDRMVVWLEDLDREAVDLVGRKCANLGEMLRVGLPVPPGFALSLRAYERFMAESGAREAIRRYLGERFGGIPQRLAEFEEASRVLRTLVEEREMPSELAEEIRSSYERLCRRVGIPDVPVAVRSSGPVSLPGQFETYLNVRGPADVIEKTIRCWGSTFTTQALAHRVEKGWPIDCAPIGVAVIKMIQARSAGVAFTVHPVTGDHGCIVIEGAWGLGESVVGGMVAPDRFVIAKDDLAVLDTKVGEKNVRVVYSAGGTTVEEVPPALHRMPCLSADELRKVGELARVVEVRYQAPQDIEWAVEEDAPGNASVFLLQTRPVKAAESKKADTTGYLIDLMMYHVFRR